MVLLLFSMGSLRLDETLEKGDICVEGSVLRDDGLVLTEITADHGEQIVGTGSTVDKAKEAYIALLKDEEIETTPETEQEVKTIKGKVTALAQAVVDGNTRYYIRLDKEDTVYVLTASLNDTLPFLKTGDTVTLTFTNDAITAVQINAK